MSKRVLPYYPRHIQWAAPDYWDKLDDHSFEWLKQHEFETVITGPRFNDPNAIIKRETAPTFDDTKKISTEARRLIRAVVENGSLTQAADRVELTLTEAQDILSPPYVQVALLEYLKAYPARALTNQIVRQKKDAMNWIKHKN